MKKEPIFIINPVAGSGKINQIENLISEVCQKKNLNYQIIYTEKNKPLKETIKNKNK